MICEKELRKELKRCPFMIKKASQEKDWSQVVELHYYTETLEWILNDKCECKERAK